MAHATKSFVVFTGGEWSEQLHGRTDLAKADSAGRKVRNFVPAQTGRLSRRKGLEFVGAALGECLSGDPRFEIPTWEGLTAAETIDPRIDVYGALGPEALRTSANVGPLWQVCPNVAYCDGPAVEGETMTGIWDRYQTRWVAKLEEGKVFYRRVGTGEDWTQVSNDLIAQPNINLNGLGFSFDANARPCFASAIGEDIHVYHYQGGLPTEQSFTGSGPRLFFTGIFHPDSALWDVVCYYCRFGDLAASFQRDNFATNYTLFSDEDYYFTRVRLVDRGIEPDEVDRHYIAATGSGGLYGLFRTSNYAHWPVWNTDNAGASLRPYDDGGAESYMVVIALEQDSVGIASVAPMDDGGMVSEVIVLPLITDSAPTSSLTPVDDGGMVTGVIVLPLESDTTSHAYLQVMDNGECETYVVDGGSYSDSTTTAALAPNDDGHCTTE